MNNPDFTIREPISKLAIIKHDMVMKLSEGNPERYREEYFERNKNTIYRYFVSTEGMLLVLPEKAAVRCQGEYFNYWNLAQDAWIEKQFEKGVDVLLGALELRKLQGTYEEYMKKYENVKICRK